MAEVRARRKCEDGVEGLKQLRVRMSALTCPHMCVSFHCCAAQYVAQQPVVDTWVSDELRLINPYSIDGFQCEICKYGFVLQARPLRFVLRVITESALQN
jgi:hypothetical protein